MRLLVLSPDFPPGRGGIQRLAGELVDWLHDDDVTVLALKGRADSKASKAVAARVLRVPVDPGRDQRLRVALFNLASLLMAVTKRPDALIVTHIVAAPAARLWSKLTRRPYVLILHGQELAHRPGLMAAAVAGSKSTVAVSRYTRDEAIRLGAKAEKIVVINPGVDGHAIPAASMARRARFRADQVRGPGRPTLITVARLVDRYKGHDVMLDALSILRERFPDVLWNVVGDGPLRSELEARCRSLELDENVEFHGSVSDEQRDLLLQESDLFAMPSRTTEAGGGEGFGLVFLEAAAAGLPVVAGATAGALDAVRDCETGLLVDPSDPEAVATAIESMLGDRMLMRTMSLAALSDAASRGWDRFAAQVRDLLRGAAQATNRGDASRSPVRVIALSHTGKYGGAERSLLTQMVADNASGDVSTLLVAPAGDLLNRARAAGLETKTFEEFDPKFASARSELPRLATAAIRQAWAVAKISRAEDAALLHANSPRAGLIAISARAFGGPRVITHVRDCMPDSARAVAVRRVLATASSAVVANSQHTANDFARGDSRARPRVVYNPLDERFTAVENGARQEPTARHPYELAIVGQITPWKRQDQAIRLLAALVDAHPELELTVAGSVKFDSGRYDNMAYRDRLEALCSELCVGDRVNFVGEVEDVASIFERATIVLVPSTEEPFGRVAIEAMASGAPVIATAVGGPREFIEDGHNGMLADPDELQEWIEKAARLLADEQLRAQLGVRASIDALTRFSIGGSETRMTEVYLDVAGRRQQSTAGPLVEASR